MSNTDVIKTVTTYNEEGLPYTETNKTVHINREGRIACYEYSQFVEWNRQMLYSMAYQKRVEVQVITNDGMSHKVKGFVSKALLKGEEFSKASKELQSYYPDTQLTAVWVINPQEEVHLPM